MREQTPTTAPERDITVVPVDDDLDAAIRDEHDSIPTDIRQHVLNRDQYCQVCGCSQSSLGTRGLVVQRITDDPSHCHSDDPDNLVVRCVRCARWIRQMPGRGDLPGVLQDRLDAVDLETSRVEILEFLSENGPALTGEVADVVNLGTDSTVRRVLYDLMALDVKEDTVEDRVVVKDRLNNTYGLPWQIPGDRRARGIIPLDPDARRSRILDAFAARLLDELDGRVENPREVVAEVVDRDPSQTYQMERRAHAFGFPFEDWAARTRSRHDEVVAVEALTLLAAATDNVSRRRIAEPVVDILERNDEHELATVVRDALLEDGHSFEIFAGHAGEPAADPAAQADADPAEEPAEPAATEATLRTFDGDVTVPRSPATGDQRGEGTHDDIDDSRH